MKTTKEYREEFLQTCGAGGKLILAQFARNVADDLDEALAQLAAEREHARDLVTQNVAQGKDRDEWRAKAEAAARLLEDIDEEGIIAVYLSQQEVLSAAIAAQKQAEERAAGLRLVAEGLADEFERTVAHAAFVTGGSKGMIVPFHGDFANAARFPSTVGRMRWWARELRAALASQPADERGEEKRK